MKLELFSIGPLTVHGYGFMIGLGIICCVLMASHRAKKQGLLSDAVYDIAIWGVLSGFLGAKLLFVIVELRGVVHCDFLLCEPLLHKVVYICKCI